MSSIDQFAAHIGLDWTGKKHDVSVQFNNGEHVFHIIEHTAEALDIAFGNSATSLYDYLRNKFYTGCRDESIPSEHRPLVVRGFNAITNGKISALFACRT